MGWLEWIGVGAGVLVLLAIIGYFIEKKEKAEKKAAAVRCPKCGADNAIYDEKTSGPYVFNGIINEDGRRMESWKIDFETVTGCTQCDYRTSKVRAFDYNVKEIADEGYSCPKCDKRDSVYLKDVKVVERYPANKEVTETTSSGKSKTRFIKVMKVIEDETYACKNCDFTSVATVTRELD
ncbi:hypothetical protein INP85_05405 [Haemophilus parainfluenzae]|uniref:hypothetical protein n=1 Tax=Haemophilus parainfluenzae TaxID=729 RepID=UPI001875A4C8|nr:hypothetical protein [Haemophilus parainfluenzae]MBE4952415.1 hypothetical protein [Haemophilus parainfluenzae]